MTVFLWRIATEDRAYESDDLSGKGAETSGGRWNRPGLPVVYCAANISLACLETFVHLNVTGLPLNRTLVQIELPDDVWGERDRRTAADLPIGWNAVPESKVSLDIGDTWLKAGANAILQVPSAIVPEEAVVLLNPRHAHARLIRAFKVRNWIYDGRMR